MKFLSIKEYFYKLNTIGFILLLLPILVFTFLYLQLQYQEPMMADERSIMILMASVLCISLLDLTIVHWLWRSRIKRLKKSIELARKMDGYFSMSLIKMSVYCGCSLIMAAGFFLTANSMFTGLFLIIAVAVAFQWPSPSSFCKSFDLRGSERDMMLHNRDLYQKK